MTDVLQIAIMYLTVFVSAGTMFVFCSFWVYHYVELGFDTSEGEISKFDQSPTDSLGFGNMFSLSVQGEPSMNTPRNHEWYGTGKARMSDRTP